MRKILSESSDPDLKRDADTPPGDQPVVDGHVDLPYYMLKHAPETSLDALSEGPFTLQKAREAGVRVFCTAIYCEDAFNGEGAFRHFEDTFRFALDHFHQILILKTGSDLRGLMEEPEGMGTIFLLENADALAGNLTFIEKLKEQGIHVVGLTHGGRNRLGDGNAVSHSSGLTRQGREVVRRLRESGTLFDTAHLHPKCFWQLLREVETPLINSHTGLRELFDIPRNIDLSQARELIDRGGVIGVTFNPEMLSPDGHATLHQIFAHLDTLVQKLGPDGVGIGSDFCGFDEPAKGLEDISGVFRLKEVMRDHGYGEHAVGKIMGLNWLRLYEQFL